MDHFLSEKSSLGHVVDTDNEFNICRVKARTKTLESAPRGGLERFHRLVDAALRGLGQIPVNCTSYRQATRYSAAFFRVEIPEVSANKYFLNIRFTKPPAGEIKARVCEQDVGFELTFCNL